MLIPGVPNEIWIPVGIALAVITGVILYYVFSPTQRAKRRFKKTPLKKISGCKYARGAVRITGELEDIHPPVVAPMSGRRCAYFEFKVEEQRSSGKSTHWEEIINHKDGHDFAVADGSGQAIVTLGLARVLVVKDANHESGTFNDAPPALEALLESYGHSSKGWIFNKNLKYSEGVLEAGEKVSVAGEFEKRTVSNPDKGTSEEQPVFATTESCELVITDDPALTGYKGETRQSY